MRKACTYADTRRNREMHSRNSDGSELSEVKQKLRALEEQMELLRHDQVQFQHGIGSTGSMWKILEDDLPVDNGLLDGAPEQRLDREQVCEAAQQFGHHVLTGQIAESGLELRPLTENIPIPCHPLLTISCPEVLRLLDVYHDECGTLYPIVDIEAMRQLAMLF